MARGPPGDVVILWGRSAVATLALVLFAWRSQVVTTKGLRVTVAEALRLAAPTLRELADEISVSYDMARQFAGGHKTPPPEVARALARVLERRAKRLNMAAAALTTAARKPREGP